MKMFLINYVIYLTLRSKLLITSTHEIIEEHMRFSEYKRSKSENEKFAFKMFNTIFRQRTYNAV